LEVYPPYSWDGEEAPEEELARDGGERGEVVQQGEVEGVEGEEEGEADQEECRVEEGAE